MKKRIWDRVRGRWLVLNPEEAVRRWVLAFLCSEVGIPATSISQEHPVEMNGTMQRADIVVFGRDGRPLIVVECKAPGVAISKATLTQAFRYNTVLGARYMMLTNGIDHYVYEMDTSNDNGVVKYIPLKEFPELK
jgi:hypothetical protein